MFPIMRRKRPTIASALSALALSVALTSLGHDTGNVDGEITARTRPDLVARSAGREP